MSRYGVPLYRARQRAHVFVTVEPKDGSPILIREFSAESCKQAKSAAREKYEAGAHLSFGRCFWRTV